MTKKITQLLKLVLVPLSLYLCFIQLQASNTVMVIYWILVAIYWLFNYLSGITPKK